MENNNDEVGITDLTNISTENQSNTVVTEMSLTESVMMDGVANQSTPVQVKKDDNYEMVNMIQVMLDSKFNEQNIKTDSNFNNLNSKMNEMNTQNESNFNEIRDEIKQQKVNINERLKEIDEHCSAVIKQMKLF